MLRFIVHYGIHFLVPLLVAFLFYRDNWGKVTLLLVAGILLDVDHLLANPIFDPNRCSIGFHPLHSYWAIAIYPLFLFFRKTRILGLALVIHILADIADCLFIRA